MDCTKVEQFDIIERYLAEKLTEPESDAFEQHYLACNRCFAELQMRHAAAIELKHRPEFVTSSRRSPWALVWRIGLVPAMVALAVAMLVYIRPQTRTVPPQSQTAKEADRTTVLEQLAAVDSIPPYITGTIRGGRSSKALERFQTAMQEYNSANYSLAVQPLFEAAQLDPELKPAVFYLGVTCLLTGRIEDAVKQLSQLTSDPNYSEESRWYLAKAYLRQREVDKAKKELEEVVRLKGQHADKAENDLGVLNRLTGR